MNQKTCEQFEQIIARRLYDFGDVTIETTQETWETLLENWPKYYAPHFKVVLDEQSILVRHCDEQINEIKKEMEERCSIPYQGTWYNVIIID